MYSPIGEILGNYAPFISNLFLPLKDEIIFFLSPRTFLYMTIKMILVSMRKICLEGRTRTGQALKTQFLPLSALFSISIPNPCANARPVFSSVCLD